MATHWYYYKSGKEHGPFTPKQFKALAAAGEVQPTDRIRKDGEPWVTGTKIEGLFPEDPIDRPAKSKLAAVIEPVEPRSSRRWLAVSAGLGVAAIAAAGGLLAWFFL